MSRTLGTVVRGVRAPIFREGDSVVDITVSTVLNALAENNITARDGDVVAVTESVVARCQGNYATCEQIAEDVRARTGGKTVGVAFPILSRNRFSLLLRGIAMGAEKVVLLLSYPSDEVGNHLVSLDQLDEAGIDPWHDVLSLEQFRAAFGEVVHPFTGVDYVAYYKSIIEEAGAQAEIVFANRVTAILPYTDTVITCDIHSRQRSKRLLTAAGARVVLGLDDLLTAPVDGSGYNAQYGLLGSNKADDDRVKLFPRDAKAVAEDIGKAMSDATGKRVEAMVYGDGAFKDPAGKIWELADPVVAPGYTSGLVGTPNELKLKYLADKEFADLSGEELKNAISEMKRLNTSIKDEKISADIDRLEDLSAKIFAQVKSDPSKLPQIRKFMDYYLPTTLKILNAYDRMGAQGVSGENIDATMQRVESMMGTIVTAFEKQLDMLFGSEAMDISADITVLENMMKREGLSEDDGELHAESGTATASQDDIKLEL